MKPTRLLLLATFLMLLSLGFLLTRGDAQPNSVKQIAPGVWFREGDIQNEGHCNNTIIEMKDYLIVIDANFPSGARKVLEDAEKALATLVAEVKDCLGETWSKDDDRSSADYAVLHSARDPAAMTLGTDQTDDGRHVVRLTLFVRARAP